MLINTIELKDFRQFKGNGNKLHFSIDPTQNVTVISGDNGTGKSTISQAFSWCLFAETNYSTDVLCLATQDEMKVGDECTVIVKLNLIHANIEYTISRSQIFTKENPSKLKKGRTMPVIFYKSSDGQMKEVKGNNDVQNTLKTIIPSELSKYFFFDGKRIEKMKEEIKKGRNIEFVNAVKNILGLDTLTYALDHLEGKGQGNKTSVLRSYNESYHSNSQKEMDSYNQSIRQFEDEKMAKEQKILQNKKELNVLGAKRTALKEKLRLNEESRELEQQRDSLEAKIVALESRKKSDSKEMLSTFQRSFGPFFMKKMLDSALKDLQDVDITEKGIPDIHKRAIDYLVKRGFCLCGTCIPPDSDEYNKVMENLDFIAPQSIGTLIDTFNQVAKMKKEVGDNCLPTLSSHYLRVREFEGDFDEIQEKLLEISKKLENKENVADIEKEHNLTNKQINKFVAENTTINQEVGELNGKIKESSAKRTELALQDDANKKIEVYKAYVEYIAMTLNQYLQTKETKVRNELKENINEIFHKIYDGGFTLTMDEDYNIIVETTNSDNKHNDIETSTAQSYSIIFSFIAGIIKMAREAYESDDNDLNTEPYPLVMDAPLSAFDKTRIKTLCEVLPAIAEQVIIFIKDTDGDLAEEHMKDKIGKQYMLKKRENTELETVILERGGEDV